MIASVSTPYELAVEEIAKELLAGNPVTVARVTYEQTDVLAEMYEHDETEQLLAQLVFGKADAIKELDEIRFETAHVMAEKLVNEHIEQELAA